MPNMLKFIFILATLSFCQHTFADICPSTTDIKKQSLHGFKAYDSEDGKRLAKNRLAHFVKHVDQFVLAEWKDTNNHYGEIHCYYRDKEGSEMETYLMKARLKPEEGHHWYQVSGSMHCAASMTECQFRKNILLQAKLAKN